jgi:hypothetical protein
MENIRKTAATPKWECEPLDACAVAGYWLNFSTQADFRRVAEFEAWSDKIRVPKTRILREGWESDFGRFA